MKQGVSPAFYNSEMESNYFHLYVRSISLNKEKQGDKTYRLYSYLSNIFAENREPKTKPYEQRLVSFELQYYKISKQNKILKDISKNQDEILKYLEPTWWKNKVDANAKKLGITPYEELSKKEEEFIIP